MTLATHQTAPPISYATCGITLPGEQESGDLHIVVSTKSGALVGVVDGLGHGSEAAQAAQVAVDTLKRYAEESVIALIRRCNDAMKATRGAVMSLASFDGRDHTMTLLGVGNVEGVLLRADPQVKPPRENVLMRGGVVGSHLPTLQAVVVPVWPGDLLILATDGIRSGFDHNVPLGAPLQQLADTICSQHSKGTDDALVLVARFLGHRS